MINNWLYKSTALLAPKEQKFRLLLDQARLRNANMDITGYLHWEDGMFYQWIEWPAAELQIVERFIVASTSHKDLTVLSRNSAPSRQFSGWSMALGISDEASLFSFVAARGTTTVNQEDYVASILAFMNVQVRGSDHPG
ncbi:BLUF domain-containing protein [Paracoccus marcusii]|uniref:BLUF domain-containing protein n=1 Tax=Paracoccus marcusii TaxID=59779 RepID=UPI0032649568